MLAYNLALQININNQTAIYLTLDRTILIVAAQNAPEAFLTGYANNLIIDEVQMISELFRALKIVGDELPITGNANGKYLLIGSANVLHCHT